MKCALILEKDEEAREHMVRVLRWLGYIPAPVSTAEEALNVAKAITFDVVVTCTAQKPDDRRSLTGELKRSCPKSTVILIPEEGQSQANAWAAGVGVSAVLKRPASMDALRRVLQFGDDGFGMHPAPVPAWQERRKNR
jgi:CheY-like chemotaxis protein